MDSPRIVLAMAPALVTAAFDESAFARLDVIGEVLDPAPLDRFDDDRAAELLGRCDVLLAHWGCPRLTPEAVFRAPRLRLVAYAAGSVKEIVTSAVWEAGITVTSAATANAVPVAEYTVAAIVLANNGAFVAREKLRDPAVRARRPQPVGNWAKQVGIIGASHVGRAVIRLLAPYNLRVALCDPFVDEGEARTLGATLLDLNEVLATSDVVSLHAPAVPSTRGMIGAAQLALMRDGTTFVNTARGAIVDHDALLAELRSGRISAVLDVTDPEPLLPDSEFYRLPNVFLTPHLAGSQGTELARLAEMAIDEVERFARHQPPLFPVAPSDMDRIA